MFVDFDVGELKSFPERLDELLKKHKDSVEEILRIESNSYDETLKRLDDLENERELFFTPLSHLNSVLNSEESQKAYEESLPILSRFETYLGQNRELYLKLKALKTEDSIKKRVLFNSLKEFELSGVNLNEDKKRRLEEIDIELLKLSNIFGQNLLDATNSFEMVVEKLEDLKGIPDSDLDLAKVERENQTVWRFTLHAPSYLSYMTYGTNRDLREKIYKAYNTRAPENGDIIDRILMLRDEKAKLLGFKNYAEYALQRRDAKSEDDVLNFLWKIVELSKDRAKKELKELEEFAKRVDGLDKLEAFDLHYYKEKLKKERFSFEENDTKPYFQRERVVEGVFNLIFELFQIEFKKVEIEMYHHSIESYNLYRGSEVIGRLYLDLEVREEKRGGAWMSNWESRFLDSKGALHLPTAFVTTNFSKSSKSYPSLLKHSDVVTLFHEIGHAIHHLFSEVNERAVSGVNGVAWDTIEFPSQFLESFAYEERVLSRFAFHFQSGEPIPKDLIRKIKSSKNFLSAMAMLRQIEFGLFDFMLHQKPYRGDEVQKLLDEIRAEISPIIPPSYNRFQHGFAHIFSGGYSAGYYSYKWAEVFSIDAFLECVGESGEFIKSRVDGYLNHILKRGGSDDMSSLYREWLGREPNPQALIKYSFND
jgi:oligopeptidase A